MSEEVKSASIKVPRAMFYSIIINGALGFGLLIALLWCADLDIATTMKATYPFVPVLYNAVDSNASGIAMVSIVTALTIFASTGVVVAASRMMWSFSRDKGLPGWRVLSRVCYSPSQAPCPASSASHLFLDELFYSLMLPRLTVELLSLLLLWLLFQVSLPCWVL